MRDFLAGFWRACSFIAGTLIGLSIVVAVFASMGGSTDHWQTLLVFSSPIILAAGITLHAIVTAKSGDPRFVDAELGWKSLREAKFTAA